MKKYDGIKSQRDVEAPFAQVLPEEKYPMGKDQSRNIEEGANTYNKGGLKMDSFMKRAVELAIGNVEDGGQPFGAVLVKNSKIIAEGVNELHKTHDVSGHAELLAIRRSQEQLQTNDLSGYTMYASGEPCPMCLTAMYFAGIDKVYYCASLEDAVDAGLGKSQMIYKDLQKPKSERALQVVQMPLNGEQKDPMKLWKERK